MDKQKKGVMVTVMIFGAIAIGVFVSTIVFYG